MKASTIPIASAIAISAMSTAALSHWWSVRQFAAAVDAGLPVTPIHIPSLIPERPAPPAEMAKAQAATPTPAPKPQAPALAASDLHQKAFYEALIRKMENLQNQNRDLLDQVAETNRDLMKLEFRVDTHSEQFRPLPVSEDIPMTRLEDDPGVLPPRAEPVELPTQE